MEAVHTPSLPLRIAMPFCCHWVKSPTSITLMAVGAVKRKVCFLELSNCLAITDCPFNDSDCFARQELNHACHPGLVCPSPFSAKPHPSAPQAYFTRCHPSVNGKLAVEKDLKGFLAVNCPVNNDGPP